PGCAVPRREGLHLLIEVGEDLRQIRVPHRGALIEAVAAMAEEPVRLASGVAQFEPAADDLAALPNEVELTGRELLGFHQYLLAHADLAEIVGQGRVAAMSQ